MATIEKEIRRILEMSDQEIDDRLSRAVSTVKTNKHG